MQSEQEIFEAAAALPAIERGGFLDAICAGAPEIRARMEALLHSHEATGFMEGGETEARFPDLAVERQRYESEQNGDRIGRYRLLQQIGEGGFGTVWMAEQLEPVTRRVALKIIKAGMDTREVIARFEAERQALAMMDHPNIAKVHDAGATDNGRPFFVMELVKGIPITKFCDEQQFSTRQRLELFADVCSAINHAHQKGIIHRDIKPSNVMVTLNGDKPVVKVIDFGIAKATQGKLTDKTLFTRFEQFIGTPAYMSPEQAAISELDIDTRSDIYGLGVLLYELLTGKPPFDAKSLLSAGYEEMRRIIREVEPPRPSARLSTVTGDERTALAGARHIAPQKLHRLVEPDLDWIVMKAIEKDRARRYETANGLALDIQRFLAEEPVIAGPPGARYRLHKFARRNKTNLRLAATLAAVLIAATAISVHQAIRATTSEKIATTKTENEKAAKEDSDKRLQAALVFVDEVFNGVAPELGKLAGAAKARQKLGQAGVDFVKVLRLRARDAPEVAISLARLLVYLSEAEGSPGEANTVGDYGASLRWAEEAAGLLRSYSSHLTQADGLHLLVRTKISVAGCLWGLGRYEEELNCRREIDALLIQMEGATDYAQWARQHQRKNAIGSGLALAAAGRPGEAIEAWLLPLLNGVWSRGVTENACELELETLADANGALAFANERLNQFEPMIQAAREAVRISDLLVGRSPQSARHMAFRAGLLAQQGHGMVRCGHAAEGIATLRKGREAIERVMITDEASDHLRVWQIAIVATQGRAFAAASRDSSAPMAERLRWLSLAKASLSEAEQLRQRSKSKAPDLFLRPAYVEVTHANTSLLQPYLNNGEPLPTSED